MSETLSRADRTQTQVLYELLLDENNEQVEEIKVTVLRETRSVHLAR